MSLDLREHLKDLDHLASASGTAAGLSGVSAKDIVVSIENACKNALDDEVAGAVSLLFDRATGLPALLRRSLDHSRRDDKPMRELRTELLNLIDWLLLDQTARERQAQVAEYVVPIASACMHTFFQETSSEVRAVSISTLLAALDLREHVPNLAELRTLLFPPDADPKRTPCAMYYWTHFATVAKTKTTDSVRGGCLRLLGRLAVLFPVSGTHDSRKHTAPYFSHPLLALTSFLLSGLSLSLSLRRNHLRERFTVQGVRGVPAPCRCEAARSVWRARGSGRPTV